MPSPKLPRRNHRRHPRHKSCSAISHVKLPVMSESIPRQAMNRVSISSQRVVKPSAKKRRPPLACIQCYQRKLKCGRELPSCSRCLKTGNADSCTYRGNLAKSSSVDGMLSDDHSGSAGAVAMSSQTPVSLTETPGRPRASSDRNGKMTHLKGQEAITKFYGYSYPLNFYQQVRHTISYNRYGASPQW